MPVFERSKSPRSGQLLHGGDQDEHSTRSLPERSVSFNRDVHVKRIGRDAPYVSAALVGDGEGRLTTTPVRRESIKSRSKEDLAAEAAYVLDAGRRYSSLPNRGRRGKHLQQQARRRRSEQLGATGSLEQLPTRPKKKALERRHSDAAPQQRSIKQTIAKLFAPKLEAGSSGHPGYESPPASVRRSHSDAAASGHRWPRKRSGSDSELGAEPRVARAPLSPIIEASPTVGERQPFHFSVEAKKPKPAERDEVDRSMLHGSRYEQPPRAEGSAIHRMIHRLSADRSPPPQLTRSMVSPGPGFGHNNNRPFSYTRPNEASSPPPNSSDVIYAQVQLDKKKAAQRSHSDSDEGLGLERKDSSRENSPAEKDYRGSPYYASELQRNNHLNSLKSRYELPNGKGATHFGDFPAESPAKDHKYTSTIFVDGSSRGRADGMDAMRCRDGHEFAERVAAAVATSPPLAGPSKSSELSARRDLLESRIKSRLLADEMFAAKNNVSLPPKAAREHEIIDKPIVPSPVVPSSVTPAKRYTETYISETRTNSNGDKYIFEKEMHDENGKVYGYEKKINKLPADAYLADIGNRRPASPLGAKQGSYSLETRTDKYGDKYIIETRTHGSYDDYKSLESSALLDSDRERFRPDPLLQQSSRLLQENRIPSPTLAGHKFANGDLYRGSAKPGARDAYQPKAKKSFEALRCKSKSTQRLDQLGEARFERQLRHEHMTRSHENLRSADYVNARELRSGFPRRLDELREGPHDDYDTDISQATNSQLESSQYYKETRTSQSRYLKQRDDYDSSPPPSQRLRNGYSSSRYDSDTTARDSLHCEGSRYQPHQRVIEEDPKKPLRRSRQRLDYPDDSDASRSKSSKGRLEGFEAGTPPQRPPRAHHHESKLRQSRAYSERRLRETRLSDSERKDRLADSGIENDYRREPHEIDSQRRRARGEESEDEGIATAQFIKQERRHTDRNMAGERRRYEKYVVYYDSKGSIVQPGVTAKPPSGAAHDGKKYEKKAAKKSGTMSKVKELFRKKERKAKEEKSKRNMRASSSGALTDDEVSMRYREYRGEQLRSARSARDLDSEINEDEYRQRRRLSTPSGSPSPPRPSRLSRSTGTLTRPEQYREPKSSQQQPQEVAERKGWFKSLSRKNKFGSAKAVDKKPRIPESEILTTGTEDEEASSAPERASVQKNLRFFGDTDQESLSSSRDRRHKRSGGEEHAQVRREVVSLSRHPTGMAALPGRKSSRLAESALSSGESTTGDSSQQSQNSQRSQRSVVYLHAATVGEIPGPNERRRAASREELNRPLAAHTRTVSRSVSVLAPWRPRNYREPYEINYEQEQHQAKPLSTMRRRQRSRETLSRRAKEPRRGSKDRVNSKSSTINRSTLKPKDGKKVDRTVSTESLASKSRSVSSRPDPLSRSTSVPRDPTKSAGWFKLKSKKSRA